MTLFILLFASLGFSKTIEVTLPESYKIPDRSFLQNDAIWSPASPNKLMFSSRDYNWNSTNRLLESSESSSDPGYRLLLGTQNIGKEEILSATETKITKQGDSAVVHARTLTFNASRQIRSVTLCDGVQKSGLARDGVKIGCITATAQFCEVVNRRAKGLKLGTPEETSKKAQECKKLLSPMGELATELSSVLSSQVEGQRMDVVNQDQDRIQNQLKVQTDRFFNMGVDTKSSVKDSQLFKMGQGLQESVEGLTTMVEVFRICQDFEKSRAQGSVNSQSTTGEPGQAAPPAAR